MQTRTLSADIGYVNAGATRWGAGLALGIGVSGYPAAFFAWRRVGVQHDAIQGLGQALRRRARLAASRRDSDHAG